MPSHSQTTHSHYSPAQLYALVADIARYPEFLPWVAAARVYAPEGDTLRADLVVKFKAFREKYTSKVMLSPPAENGHAAIDVELVEGPFTHLSNRWHFSPAPEGGTMVDFSLDFRFRSSLLEKMIGKVFEHALVKMVEAFEKRADVLYGHD